MDEINQQLLTQVQKADGDTVMMLIRQERLKSFQNLWIQTNHDFYQSQRNKMLSDKIK